MTRYAKFIDETCAAGAPSTKGGKPYTDEMAIADGYLPLEVLPPDEDMKFPVARFKASNGKVIEYYIEGEEPVVEEETVENQHLMDQPATSMN